MVDMDFPGVVNVRDFVLLRVKRWRGSIDLELENRYFCLSVKYLIFIDLMSCSFERYIRMLI